MLHYPLGTLPPVWYSVGVPTLVGQRCVARVHLCPLGEISLHPRGAWSLLMGIVPPLLQGPIIHGPSQVAGQLLVAQCSLVVCTPWSDHVYSHSSLISLAEAASHSPRLPPHQTYILHGLEFRWDLTIHVYAHPLVSASHSMVLATKHPQVVEQYMAAENMADHFLRPAGHHYSLGSAYQLVWCHPQEPGERKVEPHYG